ncbi:hypothetical protein [Stagnimonas aquatica]|uniref:hypothetical protein n=1 Tax=Stagnimonas aquatica TaxID=2689987 RepID=UPI0018F5CCB0|nr:hypothetical protein [Stagnimonas aquatica]
MRQQLKAVAGGLLLGSIAVLPAGARDNDPQLGSYLIWKFGAQDSARSGDRFHYGLRLDYDAYSAQIRGLPPLLRINVAGSGGVDTYLNGSNLRGMALSLGQVEGASLGTILTVAGAAAVGVGTVVLVTQETTKNDPPATTGGSGSGSSGSGSGSSSGSSSSGGSSSGSGSSGSGSSGSGSSGGSSSGSGSSGSGSSSGGSTSGSGSSGSGSSSGSGTGLPLGGTGYNGRPTAPELDQSEMRGISPEYQQWLDGGSGQMGDLGH